MIHTRKAINSERKTYPHKRTMAGTASNNVSVYSKADTDLNKSKKGCGRAGSLYNKGSKILNRSVNKSINKSFNKSTQKAKVKSRSVYG